ncbi:hypothetical protein [Pseudaminobacter sp. NGMCC 1.201702]|uniref:hypothetical protein n=1 Tax=Pseudaminobacter sp. NGMCC 1.201702 TaxID=3391825 RepID=UPI0039F0EABC
MERTIPIRTGIHLGSAMRFTVIGLALYVLLFAGAEWLVHRNGHMNPVFKIDAATHHDFDWVILGASHAMPLDFDGFNMMMEQESGTRILNLAGPGTGPLHQRFVLEYFLREHRTRNILYVADGFAFQSPVWNEERIADPKLLGWMPFHPALIGLLWTYVRHEGIDPRAPADYATGFSKINNRDRFRLDTWEGEASFHHVFRPSALAEKKRVEYLYHDVPDGAGQQARYLEVLGRLLDLAQAHGTMVTITKFPLPSRFQTLLKGEAEFDAALRTLAASHRADFTDLSDAIAEPRFYADTDHLNRAGVTELFSRHLKNVLAPPQRGASPPAHGRPSTE